jgi:hypothetical protein
LSAFKPENVPIISTLGAEFAVMDNFFCSHAGPTHPNRMYALSATSLGATETSTWYKDVPGVMFPQRTIFDQGKLQRRFNSSPLRRSSPVLTMGRLGSLSRALALAPRRRLRLDLHLELEPTRLTHHPFLLRSSSDCRRAARADKNASSGPHHAERHHR